MPHHFDCQYIKNQKNYYIIFSDLMVIDEVHNRVILFKKIQSRFS